MRSPAEPEVYLFELSGSRPDLIVTGILDATLTASCEDDNLFYPTFFLFSEIIRQALNNDQPVRDVYLMHFVAR